MSLFNDQSTFDVFKKKFQDKAKNSRTDARYINMEVGKTYRMRLLFWNNPNAEREGPFVEKWVHSHKNDEGLWENVVCPTTLQPKAGFNRCPVCVQNSKFWKSGTVTDKKLYDMHKRRFRGNSLVYVVNDPTTPENNGHAKILKYGKMEGKWFNFKIFGIKDAVSDATADDSTQLAEEVIGFDAFKLENGYDLVIQTVKKGEYMDYQLDFSRKATTINVDKAVLEAELASLGFDTDPTSSSDEELHQYFRRNVLDTIDAPPKTEEKQKQHPPFPPAESNPPAAAPAVQEQAKAVEQKVDKTPSGLPADPVVREVSVSDDKDIDDLVASIDAEMNKEKK